MKSTSEAAFETAIEPDQLCAGYHRLDGRRFDLVFRQMLESLFIEPIELNIVFMFDLFLIRY